MKHIINIGLTLIFFATSGFCVSLTKENLLNNKDIKISGSVALEEGQFVKGHHYTYRQGDSLSIYKHYESLPYPIWNHRAYARLQIDAQVNQRLRIIISPEVKLWTDSYPIEDLVNKENGKLYPYNEHATVTIAEGEAIYTIGSLENPLFTISGGVFPYKYNPEAANLGEYLFRTGCYPPYIMTSFDYPYPILAGFKFSSKLLNNKLSQDLLFTTETQIQPLYDWSLSYLVGYKFSSLLDIGGGVMLNRVLPASNATTQVKTDDNLYLSSTGEANYYSFAGTKLMGRVCFDPKSLLPSCVKAHMGEEDGKIFTEVALLGVKNYPKTVYKYRDLEDGDSTVIVDLTRNYYSNRSQRMPVMFGINVPTFKTLDILSIQGEWYNWPFMDALYNQTTNGATATPQQDYFYTNYSLNAYKKDSWKWSVNATKTIYNHLSIIGQLSRDHTHHDEYYENLIDNNEVFTKNNEWGWWLKLEYKF